MICKQYPETQEMEHFNRIPLAEPSFPLRQAPAAHLRKKGRFGCRWIVENLLETRSTALTLKPVSAFFSGSASFPWSRCSLDK